MNKIDIRKYWIMKLLLYPFSVLYGIITGLRNIFYRSRLFKVHRFEVPVISIGNIVAGGTGKTPFTMLCIDLLKDQYQRIVIVSRGYGRTSKGLQVVSDGKGTIVPVETGGDEPVMIARKYPKTPVIVSEIRSKGITRAVETFKADLILLDDAFQHRQVSRNCDLVLISSGRTLRDERLLPLGDLRERLKDLKRADIVMLNKSQGNLDDRDLDLLNIIYKGPVFDCFFRPAALVDSQFKKIADIGILKDKAIYVFCAIARPEKFIGMLTDLGAKVQKTRIYSDHHHYTESDLEQIRSEYQRLKCDFLITTEKDMVKIESANFKELDLVAVSLVGEVSNAKTFVDKLNQFIDIKN
jgi:tetraacyldisaccharide 4'-kinase